MKASLRRRLLSRYWGRLHPEQGTLNSLGGALHTLLRATPSEDPFFLGHGLDLLLQRLGGTLAYLVTVKGSALDTRWWTPEGPNDRAPKPIQTFCHLLLESPHRTLVLRDATQTHFPVDDSELRALGIRAAMGATLWSEDRVKGLVFVHFSEPRAFTRAELALLDAVAGFLSRVLEVEELRSSLRNLETALDITRAVVEDSSIHDPVTDLPNLRYLDIWLRANLGKVRKSHGPMTVAELLMPAHSPEEGARVRGMAEWVRGGDLVISEGNARFLVVLQRTSQKTGHAFLKRLLGKLGGIPMGATLWRPGLDDSSFTSVRKRLEAALNESRGQTPPELFWNLGEGME